MQKVFMPEVSESERIQILKNNADKVEETTYERELTQEELDAKREDFVDNSIKISTLEDELDGYKSSYKMQMEPIKKKNKVLQQEVKTKKEWVKGTLYHMANQETGFMETFDQTGEFIGSRRLKPDEKQARLFVAGKASNDQ